MGHDERLVFGMRSEVEWSYLWSDALLLEVLDVQWKRVFPDRDDLDYKLTYLGEGPHIYFLTKSLLLIEGRLFVDTNAFLGIEADLLGDENCMREFAEVQMEEIELTKDVPQEVLEVLVGLASDPEDDAIVRLLEVQLDAEQYLNSIQSTQLKSMMRERYKSCVSVKGQSIDEPR